jgi:hypothetical protein
VETFRLCRKLRRRDDPRRHRRDLRGDQGRVRGHPPILEPAGALAVAGAKAYAERRRCAQTLVAVACGANMNFDRLRFVAERAEIGEQREAVFAVTIPEDPGSFKALLRADARPAQRDRVQLPLSPTRSRPTSSSGSGARSPRRARWCAPCSTRTTQDARPHRRRDGQAPRAAPGRRPCAQVSTNCCTASSFRNGRAR